MSWLPISRGDIKGALSSPHYPGIVRPKTAPLRDSCPSRHRTGRCPPCRAPSAERPKRPRKSRWHAAAPGRHRPCLCLQLPAQPGHVDVGERLDFTLHGCRQVVVFGRHEAAQAHPVIVFQRAAECLRIAQQGRFRPSRLRFQCFQHGCRIFRIAPRHCRSQVGLAAGSGQPGARPASGLVTGWPLRSPPQDPCLTLQREPASYGIA